MACGSWLQQFGSQAGYLAALAGGQRDVPKAALACKGMDEDGEGVVRLAHVRSVDLAGVAGEDHLGAFAYAGEDGLQRGGLQVLGFVHHNELLLQRSAAKERDRLQCQLAAVGEVVDEAARVATGALIGKRHDRIMNCRHPRVEFFVQVARQETNVGSANWHEWSVHGKPFVAALLHHLFKPARNCHQRLARARTTVEGDHGDFWVEQ